MTRRYKTRSSQLIQIPTICQITTTTHKNTVFLRNADYMHQNATTWWSLEMTVLVLALLLQLSQTVPNIRIVHLVECSAEIFWKFYSIIYIHKFENAFFYWIVVVFVWSEIRIVYFFYIVLVVMENARQNRWYLIWTCFFLVKRNKS